MLPFAPFLGLLAFDPDPARVARQQRPHQTDPQTGQNDHYGGTSHLAHVEWWGLDEDWGAIEGSYIGGLWQEEQVSFSCQPDKQRFFSLHLFRFLYLSLVSCMCGIFIKLTTLVPSYFEELIRWGLFLTRQICVVMKLQKGAYVVESLILHENGNVNES